MRPVPFPSTTCRRGPRHGMRGVTLIEVMLALAICITVLSITMSLMSSGIKLDGNAIQRTESVNIARNILADLRVTQISKTSTSPTYHINLTNNQVQRFYINNDGSLSDALTTSSHYLVNVWCSPYSTVPQNSFLVRVCVSWPAPAGTAHSTGNTDISTVVQPL